ncbi:MAG: histidine ammonia-lyase [Cyclobacteriaceae bacterium]|nr:histidine ammonia-lyase [Cyclobacteriaceae bacterium]
MPMNTFEIRKQISFQDIQEIISENKTLTLSDEVIRSVVECREYLEKKLKESSEPIYGINTGFGSLYNKYINTTDLESLQENLVKSHACGTGNRVPMEIVKLMLLLKIQSLAYGHSGVRIQVIERLMDFFNHDVLPVVYEYGSLGASGDLAPLAHLVLPIIGEGEAFYKGAKMHSKEILKELKLSPIKLQAKEGLALLNGTQFMSAYAVWASLNARKLYHLANKIASASLDAFDGRIEPFSPLLHEIRPHPGQQITAKEVREYLSESELIKQKKIHVQDPYSFRCIPQVHGAVYETIRHLESVTLVEINSVTDNPNIFPETDEIISGGNFHGQPLAFVLDYISIALAELGNISERRTYQLISGARNLPTYLVANPGINSGLMILQYTAASLVSHNKQLASPSSVDSIVSSNGQEDHVSMGANAALSAYKILENVYTVLGIELIIASQALSFRQPLRTSPILSTFIDNFRSIVPLVENDRIFHEDIKNASLFLKNY